MATGAALHTVTAARAYLRFFALATTLLLQKASSSNTCSRTEECEDRFGSGSECRDGSCSNPFAQGCLAKLLPEWHKQRVCNSDDPPEAAEQGDCRESSMDFTEVRIFSQNWESPVYESWILQVVLSEMLDVPATIETGAPDAKISLYDPNNSFEFRGSNDFESLVTANDIGDCTLANRNPENYQSCAHIIPEVWDWQYEPVRSLIRDEVLEPSSALGVIGYESWYIPQFTAEKDPSLMSYLGLAGEENRKKLAEMFLRPTTWKDYCDEVSLDNCQSDDGVAKRAPQDESENNRMFVDGVFTGHFRKTDKNNCYDHPTTCTGHFGGYPCLWPNYSWQRTHHLGIALEGDGPELHSLGYPAETLKEIWRAANATKSDVIITWYSPEAMYEEFLGTDAEFLQVALPTPTQECFRHRVHQEYQCSANFTERVGDSRGACDIFGNPLQKLISSGLPTLINNPSIPDEIRNPGYDVLSRFRVSDVQLGEMFNHLSTTSSPREAICQWVVDNVDELKTFIPPSYPRVLQLADDRGVLFYIAAVLGPLATLLVLAASLLVFYKRRERVMMVAQVEFLALLLVGLLFISVGAVIEGLVAIPTDASCASVAWFVNFGYTFELVPLIIKVEAINFLMNAAKRMKRMVLRRRSLFGAVLVISVLVLLCLLVWSIVDPPRRMASYDIDGDLTEYGSTIVNLRYCCGSESRIWELAFLIWNAFLLICTSVLAFQTRKLRQEFNESRALAMMTYSHFFFVVMKLIIFSMHSIVNCTILGRFESIIYSADIIVALAIYFRPKFRAKKHKKASTFRQIEQHGAKHWSVYTPEGDSTPSETRAVKDYSDSEVISETNAPEEKKVDDDPEEILQENKVLKMLCKTCGGDLHCKACDDNASLEKED